MAKCSVCGKKIEYNKFKWYRGKVQCPDCYKTRLERKKAKKEATEEKVQKDEEKIVTEIIKQAEDNYNPYAENQQEETNA